MTKSKRRDEISGERRSTKPWGGALPSPISQAAYSAPVIPYSRVVQSIVKQIAAIIGEKSVHFSSNEEKFRALADEWLSYQAGRSRTNFAHPAYLQIIGMGSVAIPFLLREIKDNAIGFWSTALRSIVGDSPVTPAMKGDQEAVAEAWLGFKGIR